MKEMSNPEGFLSVAENKGFPGIIGSLDCIHWKWKHCSIAWHGYFTSGKYNGPALVLEASASYGFRI
jgi:hypothetical protein